MTNKKTISCTINGKKKKIAAYPMSRLLDVLREDLHLTAAKEGCGEGECGACSVFIDGVLVNSCLVPTLQIADKKVTTLEGLEKDRKMKALQNAFIHKGGAQCGICTPGMLMAAKQLLDKNSRPKLADIKEGLAGNLCRCTGYTKIFDAVATAAKEIR